MVNVDVMLRSAYEYHDKETNEFYSLQYRVYFPTGYDPEDDKKYPILFFLHGHGECGTDNALQIRVLGGENRLINTVMERDDTIIIAPQSPCNPKYEWVPLNHAWGTGSRELTEKPTIGLAAAMELLESFLNSGKVDLSRVYAAGISMGAYGTWEFITRHPEYFAAAIPLCGSGIPSLASRLVDLPIWAFHGTADATVPCQGTHDMEDAIKAAGGKKIKATYLEGIGHNAWPQAYATPGLVEWLYEQKK